MMVNNKNVPNIMMSLVTGSGPGMHSQPDPNRFSRFYPDPCSGSGRLPGTRPVCRTLIQGGKARLPFGLNLLNDEYELFSIQNVVI